MKFLPAILLAVATALVVVAVPLAIISTNVRILALDPSFYEQGQLKFGAAQTIGLRPEQMRGASVALTGYFGSDGGDLASELQRQGLSSDFFSDRETIHLKDVKDIVVRVGSIQTLTLAYGALYLVGSFVLWRRGMLRRVAKSLLAGAVLTLVALISFGALSVLDFSSLFLTFHLVSFSNDLWILDPRTDKLIRMFPSQFFFEASLTMATYSALAAVGLAALGSGLLAVARLRTR